MTVLVTGGRDYGNRTRVYEVLDSLDGVQVVIHGAARGADKIADLWAKNRHIHRAPVEALWDHYGPGAGPRRNAAMSLLRPDLVVAFPGGRGTADMVAKARNAGIEVREIDGHE